MIYLKTIYPASETSKEEVKDSIYPNNTPEHIYLCPNSGDKSIQLSYSQIEIRGKKIEYFTGKLHRKNCNDGFYSIIKTDEDYELDSEETISETEDEIYYPHDLYCIMCGNPHEKCKCYKN